MLLLNRSDISDVVEIWKKLRTALAPQPPRVLKSFESRYRQVITPAHLLAYIINPKYCGSGLTEEELDTAMEFCSTSYPSSMATIVNFRAKTGQFKPYMFAPDMLRSVSPVTWWHSMAGRLHEDGKSMYRQLLCAAASTANIERIFSTFGLVHSKLRNTGTGLE